MLYICTNSGSIYANINTIHPEIESTVVFDIQTDISETD